MTFVSSLHQYFPTAIQLELILRIVVSCLCGALIGVERSRRLKEAGLRTHVLIACTATMVMILSKYGFADLTVGSEPFSGTRGADPARLAAQVVSGISFLGAGVIFKNGSTIKGLTTAAGMWATAAIGLAFGCGMYSLGIFTTVLVEFIQILMHKIPVGNDAYQTNQLVLTVHDSAEFRRQLQSQMKKWHSQIFAMQVKQNENGTTTYSLTIKTTRILDHEQVMEFLDSAPSIVSFSESFNV